MNQFKQWEGSFPEIQTLAEIQKDLEARQTRWQQQEQKLSIGIMGQVNAGKSSFLNALLFEGRSILPEAATPKTANLTRIGYGREFSLIVEYYTQSEWDDIKQSANAEGLSIESKVAQELIGMANKLPSDEVSRCLTIGQETAMACDLDALLGILNQYTGNDGSHTALVKSTEIALPIDDLKGFEIVDTPGMNDPVASRTQKTREYMANCDVVFFLSRSSQFLDKSDADLLENQLPSKGIKRLVLVAGQFDSAILDDGYDRESLAATEANLTMRLTRVALTKAQELSERKVNLDEEQHKLLIESLANPVFSSTFAYGFAHWSPETWGKTMRHVYDELSELAEDEWDYEYTKNDWIRLANFERLQAAFNQAKQDKEQLLEQQKRSILPDAYRNMLVQLDNLTNNVTNRIELLRNKEVADIEKEKKACESQITSISAALKLCLRRSRDQAQQQANELIAQLKTDQLSFSQLNTRKDTRTEERSYEVSDSSWYNPFSWGNTRTKYHTYSVDYSYINPQDAIEQINHYGQTSAQQIVTAFGKLISPEVLKIALKKALINRLDTTSQDFDPVLFKATIENALSQLDLPLFNIQLKDTTALISQNFTDKVTKSEEMAELKKQLARSLESVLAQLQSEFLTKFDYIIMKLTLIEENLSSSINVNVQKQLDNIIRQVEDKKAEIENYNVLLLSVNSEKVAINQKLACLTV